MRKPVRNIQKASKIQQTRQLLKEGKTELAKAKFAQAREWDANVVFGDEGL